MSISLVNGNIYNHALPKEQYKWGCGWFGLGCTSANAIIPEPPTTYIAESYKNAYQTAFVAEEHEALNKYPSFSPESLGPGFINGTFGYQEFYRNIGIDYLSADTQYYQGQPYLFISAGSGGGDGFMYLDWIIVTFGVPYEKTVP
ncbi:hypothetical protein JCM14467A_08730 [Vulcanisaeta sp. JCM 14467]